MEDHEIERFLIERGNAPIRLYSLDYAESSSRKAEFLSRISSVKECWESLALRVNPDLLKVVPNLPAESIRTVTIDYTNEMQKSAM